jgi:putative Holliday junction resolvase
VPVAKTYLALDVGERRIGVAMAHGNVRIAVPLETLEVNGTEVERITQLVKAEGVTTIVIGYPRNQSGEATAQTAYVEKFAAQLKTTAPEIVFQDESLTSVLAEQHLSTSKRSYTKGDIDAKAAAMILQDYLEQYA